MPTERGAERRSTLLDAAVEVVTSSGLRGLTHRAVDARAGLAEGTTSAYFRTRLALLSALCDHVATLHGYAALRPVLARGADFPWDGARDFGKDLHARVPRAPHMLGELAVLFRWGLAEGYFAGMLGKKRSTGLGLSNLGRFPEVPQDGKARWTLSEVYLGQCDVVRGAAIKANIVGSPEGATNVTFTWGEGAIDEDLVETFIAGAKETLDAIVGP